MKKSIVIYVLILFWMITYGWSLFGASAMQVPNAKESGFRALDFLFRGQLLALGIASITASLGFMFSSDVARLRAIGLLPLGLTASALAFSAAAFFLFQPEKTDHTEQAASLVKPVTTE